MARPSILFATSRAHPACSDDDRVVLQELARRGVRAEPAVWDDPAVRWEDAGIVVLRSTWDYFERPSEFLAWLDRVGGLTQIWNPVPLVRWNAHKRYLLDLERSGITVVPTELISQGSSEPLEEVLRRRGWSDVMIKPAVGGNAYRTLRARSGSSGEAEAHLRSLLIDGDALVQPFQGRTADLGERSIVFIDGAFAHAVQYASALEQNPRRPADFAPTPAEIEVARRTILASGSHPFFARLDYLPTDQGEWRLGELELIEPELFFRGHPGSVERFADGCIDRLPTSP